MDLVNAVEHSLPDENEDNKEGLIRLRVKIKEFIDKI